MDFDIDVGEPEVKTRSGPSARVQDDDFEIRLEKPDGAAPKKPSKPLFTMARKNRPERTEKDLESVLDDL
jgi:hypothetical protein